MESDEWAVQNNINDENVIVCKIVRNVCNRLRICAGAMCCLPLTRIIPSELRVSTSENTNMKGMDSKLSSSLMSLTYSQKVLDDFESNAKGEPSDAENKKIASPETISCHLLLSQKKINYKPTSEKRAKPVKKLKFETSENILNHKRSICGLLKKKITTSKNVIESATKIKRWQKSGERNDDNSSRRSTKSNGSVKSSEVSSRSKRIARLAGWQMKQNDKKENKKPKRQNKKRANLAIFSVRCTDNESSGDAPSAPNDEENTSSSSVVDSQIIGYITHEVKKIKLVE